MTLQKLQKFNILLGSASPRRKELLSEIGLPFKIIKTNKKEKYPKKLKEHKVAEFLAKKKALWLAKDLKVSDLLITADTIVSLKGELLHKPKNDNEALKTLLKISGKTHKVITGVCIKTLEKEIVFSDTTRVTFNNLTEKEIIFYIQNYNPFDKAGSYGIQDWIGKIGVKSIQGSYSNVVGLPIAKIYQKLKLFI